MSESLLSSMFSSPVPPGTLSALPYGTGAAALNSPDPNLRDWSPERAAALQALFSSLLADARLDGDAPLTANAIAASDALEALSAEGGENAGLEELFAALTASGGLPPDGESLPPDLPLAAEASAAAALSAEMDTASMGVTDTDDTDLAALIAAAARALAGIEDAGAQTPSAPAGTPDGLLSDAGAAPSPEMTAPIAAAAAVKTESAAVAQEGTGAQPSPAAAADMVGRGPAAQTAPNAAPRAQDGMAAPVAPEDGATESMPQAPNPRIAALVDMLREAPPPRAGDAGQQAWLREVMQRVDAVLNADDAGNIDTEALIARLDPAHGQSAGAPAGGAAAMVAALLRAGGDAQARAELLQTWRQRADAAAPAEGAAAAAAPASTMPSALAGGERAAPVWALSTPLHQQTQWGEEIGDRVRWMVSQNIQSAELKITPPQLGAIEIRISLHKDQVQVAFSTPHAAVREALEDAAPRLREMLSGAGYETVNVDVSQHAPQRQGGSGGFAGGDTPRERDEPVVARGEARLAPARALGAIDFYA